jgi:hypothetical protein
MLAHVAERHRLIGDARRSASTRRLDIIAKLAALGPLA